VIEDAADLDPAGDDAAGVGPVDDQRSSSLSWFVTVGGAVLVAVLLRLFVVQTFWIPTGSMEQTLIKDDRVVVQKISDPHHPSRGDVIVFDKPPTLHDDTIDHLIKRVIGLPGESIAFSEGKVYVNDVVLDEPYLAPGTTTVRLPDGPECSRTSPCVVPPDHVWVMGDNRDLSRDSRASVVGPVDERTIVGRAVWLVWPFDRLSGL
jgi:signal peptidase I